MQRQRYHVRGQWRPHRLEVNEMYTTMKSEKAKLRAYHRELGELYADCLAKGKSDQARQLYELRLRVLRALLLREEWDCASKPLTPVPEVFLRAFSASPE